MAVVFKIIFYILLLFPTIAFATRTNHNSPNDKRACSGWLLNNTLQTTSSKNKIAKPQKANYSDSNLASLPFAQPRDCKLKQINGRLVCIAKEMIYTSNLSLGWGEHENSLHYIFDLTTENILFNSNGLVAKLLSDNPGYINDHLQLSSDGQYLFAEMSRHDGGDSYYRFFSVNLLTKKISQLSPGLGDLASSLNTEIYKNTHLAYRQQRWMGSPTTYRYTVWNLADPQQYVEFLIEQSDQITSFYLSESSDLMITTHTEGGGTDKRVYTNSVVKTNRSNLSLELPVKPHTKFTGKILSHSANLRTIAIDVSEPKRNRSPVLKIIRLDDDGNTSSTEIPSSEEFHRKLKSFINKYDIYPDTHLDVKLSADGRYLSVLADKGRTFNSSSIGNNPKLFAIWDLEKKQFSGLHEFYWQENELSFEPHLINEITSDLHFHATDAGEFILTRAQVEKIKNDSFNIYVQSIKLLPNGEIVTSEQQSREVQQRFIVLENGEVDKSELAIRRMTLDPSGNTALIELNPPNSELIFYNLFHH
ncbi:MAG: hypothetical protein KDD38_00245 [Bdellovibrionales bacterium]|nr:hypothetical protein [Bdellovibrionales bacterium]